jgi:fumarate reductase flavoprotein subunit
VVDLVRDYQLGRAVDPFGRVFAGREPLALPLRAVCVTAALLHTQGGLTVDVRGRVVREDGTPLPNLFAGGHAACGISGPHGSGYLPGSGWL